MNRTLRLFTLLAAALAVLIVVELFMPSDEPPMVAAAPQTAPANAPADAQAGDGPAEFADAVLARPLFRPGRQPYQTDGRAPISTPPADLPRLAGILLSSELRRAIFQPDGSDKPIVAGEGDSVGDWHVKEIAADSVTLVGPEGTMRLEPKFSAIPSAAADPTDPPPAADPLPPPQHPFPRRPPGNNAHKQRNVMPKPPQPPQRKN